MRRRGKNSKKNYERRSWRSLHSLMTDGTFRQGCAHIRRMLLPIHVAAGGLSIILGAVALSAEKGGAIHRRIGLLFVYSMLVTGTSGSILAFRKTPIDSAALGGVVTA